MQILSGFDGDKGSTSRRLVHKARSGEGRQVQGAFRSPESRERTRKEIVVGAGRAWNGKQEVIWGL